MEVLSLTKPSSWVRVGDGMTLPNKGGADLVTKIPKVRHILREKFLLSQPKNLYVETNVYKRVWPPHVLPAHNLNLQVWLPKII